MPTNKKKKHFFINLKPKGADLSITPSPHSKKMSLVPYDPYPLVSVDETEQGLIALMGLCVIAAVAMAAVENVKESTAKAALVDAEAQTEPCTDIVVHAASAPRGTAPLRGVATENPLDARILAALNKSPSPMTVKDIVRALGGVDKSDINSRLYTLLGKKTVNRQATAKAPLWTCM